MIYMYRALDNREYLMITFLISHQNHIFFGPSSELPCQDSSDEGSQHMFLCRNNKNYLIITKYSLSYLGLCIYFKFYMS